MSIINPFTAFPSSLHLSYVTRCQYNTQSKQYKANSTKPLRLLLDTTKLEIH